MSRIYDILKECYSKLSEVADTLEELESKIDLPWIRNNIRKASKNIYEAMGILREYTDIYKTLGKEVGENERA